MVYVLDMCLNNLPMCIVYMVLVKDQFTLHHGTFSRISTEGLPLPFEGSYRIVQSVTELLRRPEFCFCMFTVLVLEMFTVLGFHFWLSAVSTKIHHFNINSS